MALVIACEFLTGVCVAAQHVNRDVAEWPPHPARLYSALVASWGDAGEPDDERVALEALERFGPPEVIAPIAGRRDVATHYVPPNDASMGRPGTRLPAKADGIKDAASVVPALRTNRQPRTFPATPVPDDSAVVWYAWPLATPDDDTRRALAALASRVASVGHSSSLVRLGLQSAHETPAAAEHWRPEPSGSRSMRVPTPGRLSTLRQRFAAGRRPDPGAIVSYARVGSDQPAPTVSVFAQDWFVLRSAGGLIPALEAWPYVAWIMRRALIALVDRHIAPLLSEAERAGVLGQLSGHHPDGSPLEEPHVAFVPMANVGWTRYSTGAVLGAAIVLPRLGNRALLSDALAAAISRGAVVRPDADTGDRRVLPVTLGALGEWWLAPASDDTRPSLSPSRYGRAATTWSTVTPLVLDRFPKQDGDVEAIIAAACNHVGLPVPERIETHKHAAVVGSPPARPRRDVPEGPGAWRLRWRDERGTTVDRFRNRPLTHVTLTFSEPVTGPLLLGAGRYHGLGLCMPVERAP